MDKVREAISYNLTTKRHKPISKSFPPMACTSGVCKFTPLRNVIWNLGGINEINYNSNNIQQIQNKQQNLVVIFEKIVILLTDFKL